MAVTGHDKARKCEGKKMIDTKTRKPIKVVTDDDAEPYITVPLELLERITGILDANQVSYWVDEESLSIDDKPAIIDINLNYRSDPAQVQRLLDSLS
jgi:hypothetical protein